MDRMTALEDLISGAVSIRDFSKKYMEYLDDTWKFRSGIETVAKEQLDEGMTEAASAGQRRVTAPSWIIIDQITQIAGDEEMDADVYETLFSKDLRI